MQVLRFKAANYLAYCAVCLADKAGLAVIQASFAVALPKPNPRWPRCTVCHAVQYELMASLSRCDGDLGAAGHPVENSNAFKSCDSILHCVPAPGT